MTLVIRITISFLAAVTVISLTSDADAQIFRRLRDNIRTTYPPQGQVAPQQRPQLQPQGQTGRSLTPYSRLTPAQRSAATPPQAVSPANPNANSDTTNVRVVTYYDPRTGRTFQRRFVIPPNNNANAQVGNKQVAGVNSPTAKPTQPQKRVYDKIPRPATVTRPQQLSARPSITVAPQANSAAPSISINQVQPQIHTTPASPQQLPFLAGPSSVMATTPAVASPVYVQPTIQSPTPQVAPTPSVGISIAPVANDQIAIGQDTGNEIVIDTAVAPATANSNANDTSISIGSAASDEGAPVAFSVLESSDSDVDATASSTEFDIEIGSADEVEAFFGE